MKRFLNQESLNAVISNLLDFDLFQALQIFSKYPYRLYLNLLTLTLQGALISLSVNTLAFNKSYHNLFIILDVTINIKRKNHLLSVLDQKMKSFIILSVLLLADGKWLIIS